jgi:hypothetical protein
VIASIEEPALIERILAGRCNYLFFVTRLTAYQWKLDERHRRKKAGCHG